MAENAASSGTDAGELHHADGHGNGISGTEHHIAAKVDVLGLASAGLKNTEAWFGQ